MRRALIIATILVLVAIAGILTMDDNQVTNAQGARWPAWLPWLGNGESVDEDAANNGYPGPEPEDPEYWVCSNPLGMVSVTGEVGQRQTYWMCSTLESKFKTYCESPGTADVPSGTQYVKTTDEDGEVFQAAGAEQQKLRRLPPEGPNGACYDFETEFGQVFSVPATATEPWAIKGDVSMFRTGAGALKLFDDDPDTGLLVIVETQEGFVSPWGANVICIRLRGDSRDAGIKSLVDELLDSGCGSTDGCGRVNVVTIRDSKVVGNIWKP